MEGDRLAKSLVDQWKHLTLERLRSQKPISDQNGVTAPLKARIGNEVIEDCPLHDVPIAAKSASALAGLAKPTNDERKVPKTLPEVTAQSLEWHHHIRVSGHRALLKLLKRNRPRHRIKGALVTA